MHFRSQLVLILSCSAGLGRKPERNNKCIKHDIFLDKRYNVSSFKEFSILTHLDFTLSNKYKKINSVNRMKNIAHDRGINRGRVVIPWNNPSSSSGARWLLCTGCDIWEASISSRSDSNRSRTGKIQRQGRQGSQY